MRDARQPQQSHWRVLVLLLVLALSVACANTGEDDPELAPPAPSPPAQRTPVEIPLPVPPPPALQGCCRLCIRGIVCGDVCLDPDLARCATGTPTGCACQG